MTTWLIITRAIHFGACLLFFGLFAFHLFIAQILTPRQPELAGYWKTRLRVFSFILLPVILLSGAAWFALVAMTMSGQPLQMDVLKMVWTQTQFGTVWEIRLAFFLVATIAIASSCFPRQEGPFQKFTTWLQLAVNGCLLGSLAWAGHGQESSPWHLFADVLHLLAAGVWPSSLLPLFLLLQKSRSATNPADWMLIAALVRRFSTISLAMVSLLALTGFVNSWFLVGSFSNLLGQPYGRWLLAKVVLFALALQIAGVNLLLLKPRLAAEASQQRSAEATISLIRSNVRFELILGIAIIVIVAILGILPPAIH
ncbi:MAG TPA: CopD family protein [Candidatus Acidoferrales bacterium]|nr:CopD family protein [Candidatus Acidoferrales bacterium]